MTTPTFPALAINDLPLTLAMSCTSIAYLRFLKLLNDSIAAGAVANVTHTELKQHFGRTLESLWEKHVSAPYFYGQGIQGNTPQDLLDFYYGHNTALHRVEATLRRVNACGVQHPAVDAIFEEDLAKDVLEIITVFSARLYGSRSHKNQKLLDGVKAAVEASQC